jgi:TatD DNase family protein
VNKTLLHPELRAEVAEAAVRLVDTHAHVHFSNYQGQVDAVLRRASDAGVDRIITVGVDSADSRQAVELAARYEQVWATVGVHPHSAAEYPQAAAYIRDLAGRRKVVAIGECGLDYVKSDSTKAEQELALRAQIELAQELELPLVFHVREAFADFFRILADFSKVRGVVHSFSAGEAEMHTAVELGLAIGLNGIMTFTKEQSQLDAARKLPINSLVIETDCPFLSPVPYRGKTNEPSRCSDIVSFLASLRNEKVSELATASTLNAERLFGL